MKHSFQIVAEDKTHTFQSLNAAEKTKWMESLSTVFAELAEASPDAGESS
jgi:hypothetical protein